MKTVSIVAVAALLGGCSANANDQTQIATLQKQVAMLSQQVQTLTARASDSADLEIASRCATDASRELKDDSLFRSLRPFGTAHFSHWSPKLRRCFVIMNGPGMQFIEDANEGTVWASMYGMTPNGTVRQCSVHPQGKEVDCVSEPQYEQLVAQYLGFKTPTPAPISSAGSQ